MTKKELIKLLENIKVPDIKMKINQEILKTFLINKSVKRGKNKPRCLNCGKILEEVIDPIAKKKTGYLFKCRCMPGKIIAMG